MSKEKIVTKEFRVNFPQVFSPDKKSGKYKLPILLGAEDMKPIQAALKEFCMETFNKFDKTLDLPIRKPSAEKVEKYPSFKDMLVINAKSNYQPQVIDRSKQPILDSQDFYSGCYARASISFYAWEYMEKKGVGVNIHNIQKLRDGERLGGSAGDEFDELEDDMLAMDGEGKSEEKFAEDDDLFA